MSKSREKNKTNNNTNDKDRNRLKNRHTEKEKIPHRCSYCLHDVLASNLPCDRASERVLQLVNEPIEVAPTAAPIAASTITAAVAAAAAAAGHPPTCLLYTSDAADE